MALNLLSHWSLFIALPCTVASGSGLPQRPSPVNAHFLVCFRPMDVTTVLPGILALDDLFRLNLTSMEWELINGDVRGYPPPGTKFAGVASDNRRS